MPRAVRMKVVGASTLLSLAITFGSGPTARADGLPSYFKTIVGTEAATPAEIGAKDILQLNSSMFELYSDAAKIFTKNILAEHPVILGLFSGAGGRFILYRPGISQCRWPSPHPAASGREQADDQGGLRLW